MTTPSGAEFYWCVHHGRVERGHDACRADDRMGPYPTEEAARNWRETVEARNEKWEAEDRAWAGDDED